MTYIADGVGKMGSVQGEQRDTLQWGDKNSGTEQMALGTKAMWLNVMTPSQQCIIARMKATAAASVGEMEAG